MTEVETGLADDGVDDILIANRYRIGRSLGAGGQAQVYECEDTFESGNVAIKLLSPHPDGQWSEARYLRQLNDEHILPIRNADVAMGQPFLVTEVAENGTIMDLIQQSGVCGVPQWAVVRWSIHTSHAAARAHSHGLTHNDIKPSNLFLSATGDCLLGDFGCARLIDPQTGRAAASGWTAETAAPEVIEGYLDGTATASPRSDVYSIAASAYWALTGQPPQRRMADPRELLAELSSESTPLVTLLAPHVTDGLARVLSKGMSRNADDRYEDASALATALGQIRRPKRSWSRVGAHGGHYACWRGSFAHSKGKALLVCVTHSPDDRWQIRSSYEDSGKLTRNGLSGTTRNRAFADVRRIIKSGV